MQVVRSPEGDYSAYILGSGPLWVCYGFGVTEYSMLCKLELRRRACAGFRA